MIDPAPDDPRVSPAPAGLASLVGPQRRLQQTIHHRCQPRQLGGLQFALVLQQRPQDALHPQQLIKADVKQPTQRGRNGRLAELVDPGIQPQPAMAP